LFPQKCRKNGGKIFAQCAESRASIYWEKRFEGWRALSFADSEQGSTRAEKVHRKKGTKPAAAATPKAKGKRKMGK
jgi:hypothetical protein